MYDAWDWRLRQNVWSSILTPSDPRKLDREYLSAVVASIDCGEPLCQIPATVPIHPCMIVIRPVRDGGPEMCNVSADKYSLIRPVRQVCSSPSACTCTEQFYPMAAFWLARLLKACWSAFLSLLQTHVLSSGV
jgi:hypothetical protein